MYEDQLWFCTTKYAHLFVPNSIEEFNDVMSMAVPGNQYVIGLQDWAERGGGTLNAGTNWNSATGFVKDSDGIWHWMDRTAPPIDTTNTSLFTSSTINGFHVHVHAHLPYIEWSKLPVVGEKMAYLHQVDGKWRLATTSTINTNRYPICEMSKICQTCPGGWQMFDGYCFKDMATSNTFDNAEIICASQSGFVASPKTANLALWLRLAALFLYSDDIWIGISRNDQFSNWEWSIDGSNPVVNDAFDIHSTYPTTMDTAFYQQLESFTTNTNTFLSTQGWASTDRSTMSSPRIICQSDPYIPETTSTSTTTTTTVPTTTTTTTVPTTTTTTTVPTTTTTTTVPTTTTTTTVPTTTTTTTVPTTTTTTTVPYVCGDGTVTSTFEECDDGNLLDGDGCNSSCFLEGTLNFELKTAILILINFFLNNLKVVNRKIDVNIFMDSSFSTSFLQFQKMITFVKKAVDKFHIDQNKGIQVLY